jgi:hypothetical protein
VRLGVRGSVVYINRAENDEIPLYSRVRVRAIPSTHANLHSPFSAVL